MSPKTPCHGKKPISGSFPEFSLVVQSFLSRGVRKSCSLKNDTVTRHHQCWEYDVSQWHQWPVEEQEELRSLQRQQQGGFYLMAQSGARLKSWLCVKDQEG